MEKNQTELPKTASLLIITIVYRTIVNKHNATDWHIHFWKKKIDNFPCMFLT